MHPQMPTKPPSTAMPPPAPRRNYANAAGKLIRNSSHPTSITPTSSGSAAAVTPTPTTVIPDNLETSQNTLPPDHAITGKSPQTPSHAATLLPQSSQKARVTNPGLVKPDVGKINVHNKADMEKSVEPEKKVLVSFGPENCIHEGGEGMVMSGDGKDESSIQGVTEAAPAKGKKKIVKKIVKVVKKVIVKKRVPKRVLMSGSENHGLVEIDKSSNLAVDVRSQIVDEVDKSSNLAVDVGSQIVDEVDKSSNLAVDIGSQIVDEVIEKPDLVNDGFVEKPNLVDGVIEKNSLVDEVMEKPEHDKAALVACEKSNDISGFEFMEAKVSKLDSCARGSELVELKSNVAQQSDEAREGKGKYTVQNCKTGNGGILENDREDLLSGEMKTLEGQKGQQNVIFIGGLDKSTNEYDIRKVFRKAGKIVQVRFAKSTFTGKDKCFAFVQFATAAGANNALQKYSKVVIRGKKCSASIAKTIQKSNKQMKRVRNHARKQTSKVYSQASQATIKVNEPRNIDTSSFKNDRFVDSFRPQAPINYIPPPHNIATIKVNESRNVDTSSFTNNRFVDSFRPQAPIKVIESRNVDTSSFTNNRFVDSFRPQAPIKVNESRNVDTSSFTNNRFVDSFRPQAPIKVNESRNVDTSSFTNNRFVDSFRPQAPISNFPPPHNIGPAIPDHRYPLPGTKRPFSHSGHDPFYGEPNMVPPWHFGNSNPIPGPSASSNGFGMPPLPYHHQQQPGFTPPGPGPVDGWNMHTGPFQTYEQAPHYGNYPSYPRN